MSDSEPRPAARAPDQAPAAKPSGTVLNVPNAITSVRIVLSVVVFALIALRMFDAALIVFVIAAGTDKLDGYWARRYGQVTKLGRILDPFADKIIICGTFVFLVAEPASGVKAWVAVLVLAREILVTALRSFTEESGGDFSANFSGKLKMGFQCAAVVLCLASLRTDAPPDWLRLARDGSVWLAVASTIQSGAIYVRAAWRPIIG